MGLNTFFLGAILKTHMATDEQGHALQSDLRFTFLRKYNLNFNYLKADQFQSDLVGPNKMLRESYGGQVLMPLSFLPGLQLFSEFSSQTFVDSTNNFLQRYRLGYNYHRFFFFNNIEFNNSLLKNELAVSATRNLDFGTVTQGQAPVTIPTRNNNPSNARFTVTGPRRTRYSLILPTTASLIHFPAGDTLTISNFTSSPNNLRLNNSGTQEIVIGATLQAIPLNQRGGNYTGNFTVEVILN